MLLFFYYKNEKKIIKLSSSKLVVYYSEGLDEIKNELKGTYKLSNYSKYKSKDFGVFQEIGIVQIENISSQKQKTALKEYLLNKKNVISVEDVIGDTLPIPLSNKFYVKLKKYSDTTILKKIAAETNVQIVNKIPYANNWFSLVTNKNSKLTSLETANYFFETNLFLASEPAFVFNFKRTCVTDINYNQQWGINNNPININACGGWNITSGSNNINIAVLEQGIDNNHVEFNNTNFTNSFDALTRTSPANFYDDHGTHVTGIISSSHNANAIAGVAPGFSVMEISHLKVSLFFNEEGQLTTKYLQKQGWTI